MIGVGQLEHSKFDLFDSLNKFSKQNHFITAYDLEFTKIEKWAVTDIAVVQVESPYDFKDESYLDDCSYIPAAIRVNFEKKYQESGVEAMALGWGHTEKWRSVSFT